MFPFGKVERKPAKLKPLSLPSLFQLIYHMARKPRPSFRRVENAVHSRTRGLWTETSLAPLERKRLVLASKPAGTDARLRTPNLSLLKSTTAISTNGGTQIFGKIFHSYGLWLCRLRPHTEIVQDWDWDFTFCDEPKPSGGTKNQLKNKGLHPKNLFFYVFFNNRQPPWFFLDDLRVP